MSLLFTILSKINQKLRIYVIHLALVNWWSIHHSHVTTNQFLLKKLFYKRIQNKKWTKKEIQINIMKDNSKIVEETVRVRIKWLR